MNHSVEELIIIITLIRKFITMFGNNKELWKLVKALFNSFKDLKVTRAEALELVNDIYDLIEAK